MNYIVNFIIVFLSLIYSQDCCEVQSSATDECGGLTGCYIPQCSEDCNWVPMQCWGSTGYCWCVDNNGIEIDGTNTPSWEGFPDCSIDVECDEGFMPLGEDCYYEQDISVLESFINNSQGTINLILDANDNGTIEPLELCLQEWDGGRLKLLDCNPIVINGTYNWIDISGNIPDEINNWDVIETLLLPYNELSGFIPDSICDLNLDFSNNEVFDINSNNLCPPYPECVEDYVWSQSNWNADACELSDCYDVGVSEVAVLEYNGDNILNPIDDSDGVGVILANIFNDGPSCSQYPGIMITSDTPGVTFPYYFGEAGTQFTTFWYAIFSDMTYFSSAEFEVSPFVPEGTEIRFIIEAVTMHCYEESCQEDPYCHDCPPTPPVIVSMIVGEEFPNMLGDANLDGDVDVLDVLEVVNYILYTDQDTFYGPSQLLFTMIDINNDYVINITDIINIVNAILD